MGERLYVERGTARTWGTTSGCRHGADGGALSRQTCQLVAARQPRYGADNVRGKEQRCLASNTTETSSTR